MAVTRVGRTLLPRLDTSLNSSVDLSQIPAAQPPAGVTPNFVNPPSLDTVYRVSVYLFVPLMFVFVVIRLYARFRLVRKVGADDILSVLSAASIISYCATVLKLVNHPLGRHLWDVPLSDISNEYLKLTTVGLVLYSLGAMFFKLTLLSLYLRLFNPVRWALYMIWSGVAAVTGLYIAFAIVILDKCVPRADQTWQSTTFVGDCSPSQHTMSKVTGIFGLISDVYIMAIPLWLVSRLTLKPKRKAGVLAVFLTGLIAIGCSAAGLATRYLWNEADGTWAVVYALGIIESNVGLICACMPAMVLPLKALVSSVLATWNTIKIYSRSHGSRDRNLGSESTVELSHMKEHGGQLPQAPKGSGTISGLRTFIRRAYRSTIASEQRSAPMTDTTTFVTLESVDVNRDYHDQLKAMHSVEYPRSATSGPGSAPPGTPKTPNRQ